ncbi:MAG TPA: alkaline phosphatase family protein [Thermoanaerobaculia bacterium]|nr:alkaline phosphatase family protein [Thermoanaerobaculia bacterium]
MVPLAAARSVAAAAALALLSLFYALRPGPEAPRLSPDHPRRSAIRLTSIAGLPRPDHTVVVVMENHSYGDIIGSAEAPYINFLRTLGANFTGSFGVAHPSQPNYLALFAGTTEGLTDDSCPHAYADENLASRLAQAGLTFAGYAESMPSDGYTGCDSGNYARKHNPWVDFTNVPPTANLMFSRFPADYSLLPTVSLVVPNLCSDMHDCSVATGDAWLSKNIDAYVSWAVSNNSLLVLTFDESDPSNQIPTLFVGPMVVPGDYAERIDHYAVLRTLEDIYGLPATANAANAPSILDVWVTPTPTPTPTATPTPTRTPPPSAPRMPILLSDTPPAPTVVPFAPTPRP